MPKINPERFLLGLGLLAAVLLLEHLLLSRIYRKPSSLNRLWSASPSARTDLVFWLARVTLLSAFPALVALFCLPGLVAGGLYLIKPYWQFPGLLGSLVPAGLVGQVVIWLVATDLAHYLAHLLMHRVPFLWRFHRLHHAAEEFTILTGARQSWSEIFFTRVVTVVLVTLLLGLPRPEVALVVLLVFQLVEMLQHSDLPWDYGWLGWLVASPRFHRLHHSSQRADFDSNYANLFSFWDYLFGTVAGRYRGASEVADTVELGLGGSDRDPALNDWRRALVSATFLEPAQSSSATLRARSGQNSGAHSCSSPTTRREP